MNFKFAKLKVMLNRKTSKTISLLNLSILGIVYKSMMPLLISLMLSVFCFNSYAKSHKAEIDKDESTEICCFDMIIIGGGSAAFSAVKTATDMKKSVLLINAGLRLGGTCVNVGCMPSKYLAKAAQSIYRAKHINYTGIKPMPPIIHFKQFIKGKKAYIDKIWKKKYPKLLYTKGLTYIRGWAKIKSKNIVEVNGREYTAKKLLIATGASTNIPKIYGIDKIKYLTHNELFDMERKPKSITIIGAGYIGLEIACAYSQFDIKVRVINRSDRLLPKQTRDISNELEKHLTNLGIKFYHNIKIDKLEKKGNHTYIYIRGQGDQQMRFVESGYIVFATGIKANTQKLGLDNLGIKCDNKGRVIVNKFQATNIPNIFAAGDCTNAPVYVYTAVEEGRVAILNAFKGKRIGINYYGLPWVMFTNPEFAGAGIDETTAKAKGILYKTSVVSIADLAKSSTSLEKRGFIKLIKHAKTDRLLGGRFIGVNAGELAMQVSLAIKYGISVSELKKILYPYLTLSEGMQAAAQNFK